MSTRLLPEVGLWYAHRDKGQTFQVVAIDEHDGVIEIQNFDGDVDEVDLETWRTLSLERTEQPEDFTGSVDDLETDEPGIAAYSDLPARDWRAPLDDLPAQPQDATEADDDADERLAL